MGTAPHTPIISIHHYRDWSREQQELVRGSIKSGKQLSLAKDSLRVAAYFAEYFTRTEAMRLQNTGMPWRNVLELVRPKKRADRRRLYNMALKGATKKELAERAAEIVERPDTPRLSKTDALKFLDRLAKDLKRIFPIAQQAEQDLQEEHDTKKWRKRKVKTAGKKFMDLIDSASNALSILHSAIKKTTSVR